MRTKILLPSLFVQCIALCTLFYLSSSTCTATTPMHRTTSTPTSSNSSMSTYSVCSPLLRTSSFIFGMCSIVILVLEWASLGKLGSGVRGAIEGWWHGNETVYAGKDRDPVQEVVERNNLIGRKRERRAFVWQD
ncbi:hypothetical protein P153DRAFT_145361 [Dothidotthia symphoricarpi CBS 119687]|uniref:Uncharacterized protein n=1 Tax=Dothidotthia symphoricarpi CBS 119687 TaxID=1392245 RepID=A0A6A5ZVI2_9PLEO|nr:uncharacterized protein P153DRAFT_145361 [Dothidotthia symphoricarpi CBS 119687]KAF2123742.1 hypothetical protein P153DRAFT_145361 [Dothidotthia symphoricarpi CBS 119687]